MDAGECRVLIPIGDCVYGVDDANVVHGDSFQLVIKRKVRQLLGVRLSRAFSLGRFRGCIRCDREVSAGSD